MARDLDSGGDGMTGLLLVLAAFGVAACLCLLGLAACYLADQSYLAWRTWREDVRAREFQQQRFAQVRAVAKSPVKR